MPPGCSRDGTCWHGAKVRGGEEVEGQARGREFGGGEREMGKKGQGPKVVGAEVAWKGKGGDGKRGLGA